MAAAEATSLPDDVKALIEKTELTDDMDEAFTITEVRVLGATRRAIYAAAIDDIAADDFVASVECKDSSDELVERIVRVPADKSAAEDVVLECKISMEDCSPSALVEYTFNGTDWFLAQMSAPSLEYYKAGKFKVWRKMLLEPDCEAAFRRLLQIGLINHMFDHVAFPMPEAEQGDWEVEDEKTGKKVQIPRPVSGLRVWNASKRDYDTISTLLAGAPTDEEKDKYWADMLVELRSIHGDEYIDGFLGGASASAAASG